MTSGKIEPINRSVASVIAVGIKLFNDQITFIQVGDLCLHWFHKEWFVIGIDTPKDEAEYCGKYLQPALDILYKREPKRKKEQGNG